MDRKILIEQSIQRHMAGGGKLAQGLFGVKLIPVLETLQCKEVLWEWAVVNQLGCCGLSCLLLERPQQKHYSGHPSDAIGDVLGADDYRENFVWRGSFIAGWDGKPFGNGQNKEVYDFGREMWEKYGN